MVNTEIIELHYSVDEVVVERLNRLNESPVDEIVESLTLI
jgi:hypothetical protein